MLDFHAAGFEPDQIEQVINQLQQSHAVGMHGPEQFFCVPIQIEPTQQHLERGDEQCQRRAQLMADIGEESVFDLIQFEELLVAFLQRLSVLVQLIAEGKLAEAGPAVKITAGDGYNCRQAKEIEVIEKQADDVLAGNRVFATNRPVGQASADVENKDERGRCQAFPERPVQYEGQNEQDQIQARIIGRGGAIRRVNHPGNERGRQHEQRHALEPIVLSAQWREQEDQEQPYQQGT